MTKQKEKKIGSFIPKDEKKKKSIWEYREYILVGVIIVLAAVIFFFTLSNLGRNPAVGKSPVPTSSPAEEDKDVGDLVVETDPEGAVVQVLDRSLRSPATFKAMKSGKYFVVASFAGYKIHNEQVEIKPGEVTTIKIKMEK